ncbi:MAG: glycine betaine ABC transporter substrate-binding protein [Methanoculleaceae archaeon]
MVDGCIAGVTGDGTEAKIASNNLLKLVLEEAGFDVTLVATDAGPMYQAVADGDVDFSISAWLPVTQANYWDQYKDDIVLVRHNLEPAKCGLVVPAYVYEAGCRSIEDLNEFKAKFA